MAERPAWRCPCGRPWPCKCPQARAVIGLNPSGRPGEDDTIEAIAECPKCGQEVFLEFDPENVVEWEAETGIVREVDTGAGQCCGLLFAVLPDGSVECFRLEENQKGTPA